MLEQPLHSSSMPDALLGRASRRKLRWPQKKTTCWVNEYAIAQRAYDFAKEDPSKYPLWKCGGPSHNCGLVDMHNKAGRTVRATGTGLRHHIAS